MKSLCLITVTAFLAAGLSASAADGNAVFTKECAKCHGADGKGDTPAGKKLKCKDLTTATVSDAQIAAAIKDGIKEGDKMRMKPIAGLSDADVQAVTKYVHSLKK